MWPKCRGRRLPVKLTGAPAAAAAAAAPAPAAPAAGGPPLSLVVDCSLQAVADGGEARVQAVAALPAAADAASCGCSRKPCCCLPGAEPAASQQDQLRPANYDPREALFRALGGRWYHLVPFADTADSNEEDRPRNLLFKLVPDNLGEYGKQGVYPVEEPVQEKAPTAMSEVSAAKKNITQEADHLSGPYERISPTPVASTQTVKHLTEATQSSEQHTEHRGSLQELVPSGQEQYLVAKPVQGRAPPALSAAETNVKEMGPDQADYKSNTLKRISPTPVKSTQAVSSQREQMSSGQEPPRQITPPLRQKSSHHFQQPSENRPSHMMGDGAYKEMCGKRLKKFLAKSLTDLEAPIVGSHVGMDDKAFRETCGRRLRNFLVDDSTLLRSPMESSQVVLVNEGDTESLTQGSEQVIEEAPTTDSHKSLSVHPEVDEWETVEVVDMAIQTSQEGFPIPEELNPLINDASLAHIRGSPLPLEGELHGIEESDEWETMMEEEVGVGIQTSQEGFTVPEECNPSLAHMRDSPLPLEGELHGIEEVDEWETVLMEEVDASTQTSQDGFPIPEEPKPVINDSSQAEIQESHPAVEEELHEGTDNHQLKQVATTGDMSHPTIQDEPPEDPSSHLLSARHEHSTMGHESLVQDSHRVITEPETTGHHESVNIHAQDADELKPVLVDLQAATHTSQERLTNPEELSASFAHERKSSLAVEKPPQEDRQSGRLQSDVLVPTEPRPSNLMVDDTYKEMCDKRLKKFLEDDKIDLGMPSLSTIENPHQVIEEAPSAQSHESVKTHREQESVTAIPCIQDSQQVIEKAASSEKLIERMRVQQDTMVSAPSLFRPSRVPRRTKEMKPRRLITDLERLSDSTERSLRVLPRITGEASNDTLHSNQGSDADEEDADEGPAGHESLVQGSQQVTKEAKTIDHDESLSLNPEDADEQESEVEELDATTQTSREWFPSAEELAATTNAASLASIRESPREIMEEPPESGHIEEARSQKEKISARAETNVQGSYKATETIKPEKISPGTTTYIQRAPSATEERVHENQHFGKPSSQPKRVSVLVSKWEQSAQPTTKETLQKARPPKITINKEEEVENDDRYNAKLFIGLQAPPTKTGAQHPGKRSSHLQQVPSRSSESKQDVHPTTDEELRVGRLAEKAIIKPETIQPGTITYIQRDPSVIEERAFENQHLEKLSSQPKRVSVLLSRWQQSDQPATKETLQKARPPEIINQESISSETTTDIQGINPVTEERVLENQHLGQLSSQPKRVSVLLSRWQQPAQPATKETLQKARPPEIINQESISSGTTTDIQGINPVTEERVLANQHLGQLSSQPKRVSVLLSRWQQPAQTATKETLQKARPPEIINQESISSGTTTDIQGINPVTEERVLANQHLGQLSSQPKRVSVLLSRWQQPAQPATKETLQKARPPKIINQEPISSGTTTSIQGINPVTKERAFENQHLEKLSSQPKRVSVLLSRWQQSDQPATKETLQKARPPKIINQEPISSGTTTSIQGINPVTKERVLANQHRGQLSGQPKRVSIRLSKWQQSADPATKETLQKARPPEIINQESISSGTTTDIQGINPVTEERVLANQHLGQLSSQPKRVSVLLSRWQQPAQPATKETLQKASPPKIVLSQEPNSSATTTNIQGINAVSKERVHENQHLAKLSSQPKRVSVTLSKWKQDVHPATKETLQMARLPKTTINQKPISPGTTTNIQGVNPVTEKTLHGGLRSKMPVGQQNRYTAKLEIPVSKAHSAKEQMSRSHKSPGTFPFGQESVPPKSAGRSTIRAGHAPERLRLRPDKIVEEESKVVTRSGRSPDKLKFWQEKVSPRTMQEKRAPTTEASTKGTYRTKQNLDRVRHLKKIYGEKHQISEKPGTHEEKSSEDDSDMGMRGGRKVRLTPVPAGGSRGEPEGLVEQTRLLPRSPHRRLILKDTAAEGQGTSSTKPAGQQAEDCNCTQQVAGPRRHTPAGAEAPRQGTHTAVHGDPQPGRLGGQQLLLFLLLPSAFPFRQAPLFGQPEKPKPPVNSTHPTTEDVWREDPCPGPCKEHMAGRPETQIKGTISSTQEPQRRGHRVETLDSQQEPSLSRQATFNPNVQQKMRDQPCGNCSPVRFSCQQEPLPSRPETPKNGINIAIIEVPRSDCSLETLDSQKEPFSSMSGTLRHGIRVPPRSYDSLGRLSSQWEPQSLKLGTSKYGIHIPIQESPQSCRKPAKLGSQQELLSSIPRTSKYGIQIPIQKSLHTGHNLERFSCHHAPLSSTLETFKCGIHIPIRKAPFSYYSTERLSGKQELLFTRPSTSKCGIQIPFKVAPHFGLSPVRFRSKQNLVVSRSGTSKHGIYIPVQEARHSGLNYERLSNRQNHLSPKPGTSKHGIGTSKHGIHIPVQVAPHVCHSPDRLSSELEPLSSRLGTSKYGIRIPIQEAPCSYCSPQRLSNHQKVVSSTPGTSKHGIHIPILAVPTGGHHIGKLTGQHDQMTVSSKAPIQKPLQDNGPIHFTDKQTQMPDEPQKNVQGIPVVTEEEPLQNHRSWILSFLLDRLFGTPKPSTQHIEPTTKETLNDDHPSEVQRSQLQEMLATSDLMTHRVELEQMTEKVEGPKKPNHSDIQGEPRPDRSPNHISDEQTQESARSKLNLQVSLSTKEEEPLQDRRSGIFSFLQDQLLGRIKESMKRTQLKKREGLQEEPHPEECSSGQQHQVSATPNESKEDSHPGELHIDHRPECVRGLQEKIPAIPETTTEHISLTIDEKFSEQHVYAAAEKVLQEKRAPEELNTQQEQLSERADTSMQGIQRIMEQALHVEEPLEHEQLSKIAETLLQGMWLTAEDAAHEEEQLSSSPQTSMQQMQATAKEILKEEGPFEQKQLPASPQTSMRGTQLITEEASYDEEQCELDMLSDRPQASKQTTMEEVLSEEEPLEQKQLPASPQTSMQGTQLLTEEASYDEEQLELDMLSDRSQESKQTTMEEVLSEEEPLEQKQLAASPQTSMQGTQLITEEASYDQEQLELDTLSARPQASKQPTVGEVLSEKEPLKQQQLPASLQTSMQLIAEEASCEEKELELEQLSARSQTSKKATTEGVLSDEDPLEKKLLLASLQAIMEGMELVTEVASYEEEQLEHEHLAERAQTSMQGMQASAEEVPDEEEPQKRKQLPESQQTFMKGMQYITEEIPDEKELLEEELLSVTLETSMQSMQPTTEEAPDEQEQLEQELLSATLETSMQSMQPTTEEVPHWEEPLKQEQLSVAPQRSLPGMELVIEDATLNEEQLKQEQLLARPQTSMQCIQPIKEDAHHGEEQLEQEQLSATLQTSMQSLQPITVEAPHEEEPVEQDQLSAIPKTSMQPVRADAPHEVRPEEVQLSTTPQAFKKVLQPIVVEAYCEEHPYENSFSQQGQATTSEQDIYATAEEPPSADDRPSLRQKRNAAKPARSVSDARPTKDERPHGGHHPGVFRSLQEKVSADKKSVEKRIFPSRKMAPGASGERLRYGQERMTAKLRKNRNTVAVEVRHVGSP